MKATPLYEGSFSVDASKKFLPFNPETDDPKDRPASLFVFVQPFLIQTKNKNILLDAGLGFPNAEGKPMIFDNLEKAGCAPEDIDMVLMSHLHFDHSGGMVVDNEGDLQLSFPNAEYFVQRGEWETAYSKPSKSYKTEIFDVLQRSGNLNLLEGNGILEDIVEYQVTGGHTEFHQAFILREEGKTIFFGGDVLPEPEQLLRKFAAKYDLDGRRSMQLREEYGLKAAEEDWECLFYHARSKPKGKVIRKDGAFQVKPVE